MNHTNDTAMTAVARLYHQLLDIGVHIEADGSLWGERGSALHDPRLHAMVVEFRPALMVFIRTAHKTAGDLIER